MAIATKWRYASPETAMSLDHVILTSVNPPMLSMFDPTIPQAIQESL